LLFRLVVVRKGGLIFKVIRVPSAKTFDLRRIFEGASTSYSQLTTSLDKHPRRPWILSLHLGTRPRSVRTLPQGLTTRKKGTSSFNEKESATIINPKCRSNPLKE
jgi:hypothetical protein